MQIKFVLETKRGDTHPCLQSAQVVGTFSRRDLVKSVQVLLTVSLWHDLKAVLLFQ